MIPSTTCQKVTSLLSSYIDKKLDKDTHDFVKSHLEICPDCHRRYITLKNLIKELRSSYKDFCEETSAYEKNRMFNIKEYQEFHSNLSSYFDNELTLNESVNVKKYMIKYPNARRSLEEMYRLHKLIDKSVQSTKKTFNKDYAKTITYRLRGINPKEQNATYLKIASFTLALLIFALLYLATLPVGKEALDKGLKFFKKNTYVQTRINKELAQDLMY